MGNVHYGEMPEQLGGLVNPPNIRGHDLVIYFMGPVKLADNELGVREGLDMVSSRSVAELCPCDKGFVFGLIVGRFQQEFKGMLISCSSGTFYDETGSTVILN